QWQIAVVAGDHGPAAQGSQCPQRRDPVRQPRFAGPAGARKATAARQAHRHDFPGADDLAEPAADPLQGDAGCGADAASGQAPDPVPARTVGRHASAGDDRDGDAVPAGNPHRRRTDHGAGWAHGRAWLPASSLHQRPGALYAQAASRRAGFGQRAAARSFDRAAGGVGGAGPVRALCVAPRLVRGTAHGACGRGREFRAASGRNPGAVLRWSTATHLHRPGIGAEPQSDHRRRIGLGAGRVGSSASAGTAGAAARRAWLELSVHFP
nr:hypothetical protein [Tanacetum cinerariifolium]